MKAFEDLTFEKAKPEGDIIIELDEIWHFMKSKKQTMDMESILS